MYLIIGGSGFLGRYLINYILKNTNDEIIATYSTHLPTFLDKRVSWVNFDLQNEQDIIRLNSITQKDTKTIYLASCHNPDIVEEMPEFAWNINITNLANFVNKYKNAKCLYYSSTDVIYGESLNGYRFKESDKYNPINLYGKHKALAEQIVLTMGYNVVRFPLIMGPSIVRNKKHFFDYIKEEISSNRSVDLFEDSYRSTLSFNQCAKFLVSLIEQHCDCREKIVNIASDNPISKFEIGLKIANFYNLDKNLINPISIKKPNSIFKAKRARSTILDNTKLKKLLNIEKIELEF